MYAKTGQLTVEEIADGLIVFDGSTKECHALDRTASAVFRAADGQCGAATIASETGVPLSQVRAALIELEVIGLLRDTDDLSRRSLVKRGALVGGVAMAPMVMSVLSPRLSASASVLSTGPGSSGGNSTSSTYRAAVLAKSPSVYYRLNETSGTTAADSSGSARNATYISGVTFGATGATTDGDKGVSRSTAGSGVATGPNLYSGNQALTIVSWFKHTGTKQSQPLVSLGQGNGSAGSTAVLGVWPAGSFNLVSVDSVVLDAGYGSYYSVAANVFDGNYHQIAMTRTTGNVNYLFVDGAPLGGTWGIGLNLSVGPVRLGSASIGGPNGNGFSGTLDEVAVFPSALSSSDIAALYAAR